MALFYDTVSRRELTRLEHLLRRNGIRYSVSAASMDTRVNEIMVAEEDLVFAELLLASRSSKAH
jgi:hypothetical protein